jgi:hypothetical protein
MSKWDQYFPFNKGDRLDVDGPWNYDGEGEVLDLNDGLLDFNLHIPAVHVFFKSMPEMSIHFGINYVKEGDGNQAKATINGRDFDDPNVIITSREDHRLIQSSILIQGKPLIVKMWREENVLKLDIQGYRFDATRKEFLG